MKLFDVTTLGLDEPQLGTLRQLMDLFSEQQLAQTSADMCEDLIPGGNMANAHATRVGLLQSEMEALLGTAHEAVVAAFSAWKAAPEIAED